MEAAIAHNAGTVEKRWRNSDIGSKSAESVIRKTLMDSFLAERFFPIGEHTTVKLGNAPEQTKRLFAVFDCEDACDLTVFADDRFAFLVAPSCKQGVQWVAETPVFRRADGNWEEIASTIDICRFVLQLSLSEEAYAQPGVAEFETAIECAIAQLACSMERAAAVASVTENAPLAPFSAYDRFLVGERLSSLRDRPFHPTSKAKIGYTESDCRAYLAEFGKAVAMRWVAIANRSVVRGIGAEDGDGLLLLTNDERDVIIREMADKGFPRHAYTLLPVHPWQLQNVIATNFGTELEDGTIIVLDAAVGYYDATSSVRSFAPRNPSAVMLKLPISVMSLGASRYLPAVKLLNGQAGERLLRQAIACDEKLAKTVLLCEEDRWWGYMPQEMGLFDDHPRHLAAQIRVYPQQLLDERHTIVPMSALGVTVNGEHPMLTIILGERPAPEDAVAIYKEVAELFYDMALRLFKVGVVPELHGQNCCLVFRDRKLTGLLFRDHDSVRVHLPYLEKHGIADPRYRIRPGFANSLYNETVEKLIFYVQSLGTQVNLAAIMEAFADAYSIPERRFWDMTAAAFRQALCEIDIPEDDRKTLLHFVFEEAAWPWKQIVRPLLEASGVPGAMPSGKGGGVNPFCQEYGLYSRLFKESS